ncbi:MAG: hypothetical protein JSV46_11810 [Candidatus Aminicenantes bacterium]|nr:MAG: hypothetical protein JSV46_11810 [Candidatus Aminicenantes bacterium]
MKEQTINLPKTVGAWTRPDSPQRVTSQNIFDYMNGAGELYLGYRFDHLEVYEYTSSQEDEILVELYFMATSDDAFGLLSLDWGGEPITWSGSAQDEKKQAQSHLIRALYGEGLLRIWADNLYARVMATRETPASRKAVLALGKAITADQKNPQQPKLVEALSPRMSPDWKLRKDRMSFFRSYLVLNSIYYLSQQNILQLDHSTEAVTAPYTKSSETGHDRRTQFLLIKYENPQRARNALGHFHDAFLPDHKKDIVPDSAIKNPSTFEVEEGWLGYQLKGQYLAIVFDCPDQESAQNIIHQNVLNLPKMEE